MRKTFLMVIALFFGLAVSAQAVLIDWDQFVADSGTSYVIDRHESTLDEPQNDYNGYTGEDYTGYYIGTIQGNTDAYFIDAIEYYASEIGLVLNFNLIQEYTANVPSGTDMDEGGSATSPDGKLTVTWNQGGKAGTWTFESYDVIFYAVKGGDEFALYYVDPALTAGDEGNWTSRHTLNPGEQIPTLSHLSVAAEVPEPATMLLMGTGLLFLAGFLRRRIYSRK